MARVPKARVASLTATKDVVPAKATPSTMAAIYRLLGVLVILYLTLGLAYARATPPWQAPDEPAHFNYVKYLADRGQLPVLRPGDYPSGLPLPPQARLTDVSAFRYEAHQPPLFYALAAAIYKVHPTLMAVRALSLLFGAALLPVVFFCGRFVMPEEPWVWLGAAAFAGFIPMHLFIAASANNDTLADLLLSLLLLAYLAIDGGWRSRWRWVVLGVLLGLAMLTKLTIYPAAVLVAALAIALAAPGSLSLVERAGVRVTLRQFLTAAGTTLVAAAVISGWWFVRNGLIYGWTDMLIQSRQAQVAGSQTPTGAFGPAQFANWVAGSFHSFWGQFGWMSLPLPQWQYLLLLAFSAMLLVGWVARGIQNAKCKMQHGHAAPPGDSSLDAQNDKGRATQDSALSTQHSVAWLGLAIVWLGTAGSYLYYNLTFLQTQGRYLFPALAPIGIVCAAGVAGLFPKRAQPGAMIGLSLAMLAFATYALQRDLIPAFG